MMCLTSPSTRLRLARALVLACGLFSATFSTHAVTMPFTVNLDTNLSVAHISIDVLGKNDSQDAQLAGSFVVDIDSLPTPTSAGIGDFRMQTLGTVSFNINLGFLGAATAKSPKFVVKAHLPPLLPILKPLAAGDFTSTNVIYDTEGSATYKVTGPTCVALTGQGIKCTDTVDFSKAPPAAIEELNGHLDIANNKMRVEITGFFSLLLDPTNPLFGVLSGTFDAVGVVDLPPVELKVKLEASKSSPGHIKLRWPKAAAAGVLYQTDVVAPTATWTKTLGTPQTAGEFVELEVPTPPKGRFFSLR